MKNKKNSFFCIFTIICFCSVVFIPFGLAFMWFFTGWKKNKKIIVTSIFGILYAGILIFLLLFLRSSDNSSGIGLAGSYKNGSTSFDTEISTLQTENKNENLEDSKNIFANDDGTQNQDEKNLPSAIRLRKNRGGKNISLWLLYVGIFLVVIAIIIRMNLKNSKTGGYENPYVDTNLYKLPLKDDSKLPIVHFLKLRLKSDEKILFATETTKKGEEGDFVVTNQRVVILDKNGIQEFPLFALTAVCSITNSVMQMTSGERKYYIFIQENQMKYALAVVRWAFAKASVQS